MSHYYLDASAVVKRYSLETGTAWVRALTDPTAGHTMLLGEITLAEVTAAIAAKHRAPGGITVEERGTICLAMQSTTVSCACYTPWAQRQAIAGPHPCQC